MHLHSAQDRPKFEQQFCDEKEKAQSLPICTLKVAQDEIGLLVSPLHSLGRKIDTLVVRLRVMLRCSRDPYDGTVAEPLLLMYVFGRI